MSDTATLLLALSASLVEAATYNKSDQVQPAAVLWPDKERQWEPLLPILRQQVPLLTMGAHDPTTRTGPAYYLRCMIAGTLEDRLPADAVPILYLPGFSRQELRAVEDCPKALQPLVDLQYRGVFFSHKNGKDWTISGFLQSSDGGLGIALGQDSATREAMQRALLKLAHRH